MQFIKDEKTLKPLGDTACGLSATMVEANIGGVGVDASCPPPVLWITLSILFSVIFSFLGPGPALGAPYPPDGRLTEWLQPDGTPLTLRVFGDEYYARTTTGDGYTVIFDQAQKMYLYARTGEDGVSLVSTGVPAHHAPPGAVPKHLKESNAAVSNIRARNIQKFASMRAARWEAKVQAVRFKRALAAGQLRLPPPEIAGMAAGAVEALADPATGSKVGLMILVQFPDDPATAALDPVKFPSTQAKMVRYCNQRGYSDNGNTGSVRDYFYDQSYGRLSLTHVVTAIITLPHPKNYYNFSDYPINDIIDPDAGAVGEKLVTDAIAILQASDFNFSALSVNAFNQVLATSVLFAGFDSGQWARGLWPHSSGPSGQGINVGTTAEPRYIYRWQCTDVPDSAPVIGTTCHELGHLVLDYPDLYDTDVSDGDSEGLGEHCLMASGNWLDAGRTPAPINLYLKDMSGWANISDVAPAQSLNVVLPFSGNRGYRYRKPGSPTEYFIVENRWLDDKWAYFCPDKGVVILHIDEAVHGNDKQQMTSVDHYEVSLEQADGRSDLERSNNRGDGSDLFTIGNVLNSSSSPSSNWWNGTASGLSISVLSAAGASVNVRFGTQPASGQLSASPLAQSVPHAGSTASFTVSADQPWTWSVDADWVTSTEEAGQTGTQTFTCSVAPNPGFTSRIAVITLLGGSMARTHTITQGPAPMLTINPAMSDAASSSDTASFTVISNQSWNWSDDAAWVTSSEPVSQSGVQEFTCTVAANPVTTNRTAVITFAGGGVTATHTITQAPAPTLSVSPTTQNVISTGAAHGFMVISNRTWTWSENAAWLTTSETTSQTGDQSFTYTVAPNMGVTSRSTVITFTAGSLTATHTVTQDGAPSPDLADTSTSKFVTPTSVTAGQSLSIGGTVRNQGALGSGTYVVRFYLSADNTITPDDHLLGEKTMPALASGADAIIDMSGLPVTAGLPLGSCFAGWILDATNMITEGNELNNTGVVSSTPVLVYVMRITQTLGDGSISSWGNPSINDIDHLLDATLTTGNGFSGGAFDGVGKLTFDPPFPLPRLAAVSHSGPLTSSDFTGPVSVSRRVSLVAGRHASDEEITLTNTTASVQSVTLRIDDDYGSDGSTQVHGTSSGDTVVTTADSWFVSNDQASPSSLSDDPTLMVSWLFSSNLPAPSFPAVPGTGGDTFGIDLGTFSLAAGQTAKVIIRRELFDTAELALANGQAVMWPPADPAPVDLATQYANEANALLSYFAGVGQVNLGYSSYYEKMALSLYHFYLSTGDLANAELNFYRNKGKSLKYLHLSRKNPRLGKYFENLNLALGYKKFHTLRGNRKLAKVFYERYMRIARASR